MIYLFKLLFKFLKFLIVGKEAMTDEEIRARGDDLSKRHLDK